MDGRSIDTAAGAVDHATFTPVRMPGSRPITALWPGWRGEQQVAQVVAGTLIAVFRLVAQRVNRSRSKVQRQLDAQVQRGLGDQDRQRGPGEAATVARTRSSLGQRDGCRRIRRVPPGSSSPAGVQDLVAPHREHRERQCKTTRSPMASRKVRPVAELALSGIGSRPAALDHRGHH